MRSKVEAYEEQHLYQQYITDAIFYHGQNKVINVRFEKVLNPDPVDKRAGDDIAADIIGRLGLELGDE